MIQALSSCLAASVLCGASAAQCFESDTAFTPPGVGGSPGVRVTAQVVADLGGGPALYVGGHFGSAGAAGARHVARWNGSAFESLSGAGSPTFGGGGPLGIVRALEAFDDGAGAALYLGGDFVSIDGVVCNDIAKWDGSAWSPLGAGLATVGPFGYPYVSDLAVWNDGSGAKLYVAGRFTHAGGQAISGLASWDGTSWSAVGPSLGYQSQALAVHQGELVVSGYFSTAQGAPDDRLVLWNGTSFSTLGGGLDRVAVTLLSFDDGSGPALYAGCDEPIGGAPANLVRRWQNGWSAIGSGLEVDVVRALAYFDDGSGAALYAGGYDSGTPALIAPRGLARRSGSTWIEADGGVDDDVNSLVEFDAGGGPALFVGGNFTSAGGQAATAIARCDANGLTPLLAGGGRSAPVDALAVHDSGAGPELISDDGAWNEGNAEDRVERWTGSEWQRLGTSNGDVRCLSSFAGKLYAGGNLDAFDGVLTRGLACWDGSAWSSVGGSSSGACAIVTGLATGDLGAGARLFVAGCFESMGGVAGTSHIAAWDGANWSALAGGLNANAVALAAGSVGGVQQVFVSGWFHTAGGWVNAQRIASWDGTSWRVLGTGLNGIAYALAVFDDGSGAALYAGGSFTSAGGVPVSNIAKWDGAAWFDVGGGCDWSVLALEVFDDGYGAQLYAGGGFTHAGGIAVQRLARWNATGWSAVANANGSVLDLATFTEPGRPASLALAGMFMQVGGVTSHRVALWSLEGPCVPATYCTAKTNSAGCVPSAYATGEARFVASTLHVHAASVLNNKTGLLFWGRAAASVPFQGGLRCVANPLVRTAPQDSSGNAGPDDCSGAYSFHFDSSYFAAHALVAGDVVYAQYWSRDPGSASTTGLTDAVSFQLSP